MFKGINFNFKDEETPQVIAKQMNDFNTATAAAAERKNHLLGRTTFGKENFEANKYYLINQHHHHLYFKG